MSITNITCRLHNCRFSFCGSDDFHYSSNLWQTNIRSKLLQQDIYIGIHKYIYYSSSIICRHGSRILRITVFLLLPEAMTIQVKKGETRISYHLRAKHSAGGLWWIFTVIFTDIKKTFETIRTFWALLPFDGGFFWFLYLRLFRL